MTMIDDRTITKQFYTGPKKDELKDKKLSSKHLEKMLAKLLPVGKTIKKAEDGEKLLSRQLKEKPLKPPKADDPYWNVDDAYLDELAARVEAEAPQKSEPVEIHVHVPEQQVTVEGPKIDVHVPEQPAPQISVEPRITVESPKIDVHVPEQPAPQVAVGKTQVDVHIPEVGLEKAIAGLPVPQVIVNVPEQPVPQVTVEAPQITVESPKIDVHVPEQPAPQVIVEGSEVDVHLEAELVFPEGEIETVVERDEMGRILRTVKKNRKKRRLQ